MFLDCFAIMAIEYRQLYFFQPTTHKLSMGDNLPEVVKDLAIKRSANVWGTEKLTNTLEASLAAWVEKAGIIDTCTANYFTDDCNATTVSREVHNWIEEGKRLCQEVADELDISLIYAPLDDYHNVLRKITEREFTSLTCINPSASDMEPEDSNVNPLTLANIEKCLPLSLNLTS